MLTTVHNAANAWLEDKLHHCRELQAESERAAVVTAFKRQLSLVGLNC